jgi:hypothetical protein
MKLPPQNIYVNPQKVRDYLLNINHPDGGPKAKLLLNFGFTPSDAPVPENAIVSHAMSNEVSATIATAFGEKYLIEGPFENPIGKALKIRSVWVKELNGEMINFVTLYPI